MKSITGILLATVVVFMWGFLFWGTPVFSFVFEVGKESPDETAARSVLKEHFPENGLYFVPSVKNGMEEREKLHKEGPVAFVYMAEHDGGPMLNPKMMGMGFGVMLITNIILFALIKVSCSSDSFFVTRFLVVFIAGLAAAVCNHGGDAVWWMQPLLWKSYQAFYQIVEWSISGAILAWFTGKKKAKS